jgi:hypothetical protein
MGNPPDFFRPDTMPASPHPHRVNITTPRRVKPGKLRPPREDLGTISYSARFIFIRPYANLCAGASAGGPQRNRKHFARSPPLALPSGVRLGWRSPDAATSVASFAALFWPRDAARTIQARKDTIVRRPPPWIRGDASRPSGGPGLCSVKRRCRHGIRRVAQ